MHTTNPNLDFAMLLRQLNWFLNFTHQKQRKTGTCISFSLYAKNK